MSMPFGNPSVQPLTSTTTHAAAFLEGTEMSVDPAKVELGFHARSESCDLGQGLNVAGLLCALL